MTSRSLESLEDVLDAHHLWGDTSQVYDAAGQCSCGHLMYERGGDPEGFLDASKRLLRAHAAHQAVVVLEHLTSEAVVEAAAEGLFGHFNAKHGYQWPAPEQHLPWWRDAARAALAAAVGVV